MTVLSFLALSCGAGGPLLSLFATATPTSTVTPSIPPSPTPTLTPTATLTPTPIPTGVQKTEQSDGSVLVTDYDAGYKFQISKDWLILPATMEDLQKMADKVQSTNPDMAKALRAMKFADADALRLMAMNQNKETQQGTALTNLNVLMQKDDLVLAFPLDFFIDLNVEQIKSALPTARVLASGVTKNTNGFEIGYIEIELKANSPTGQTMTAYEKMIVVKTETAVNILTFASPSGRKETVLPIFDEIINSIELLK